MTSIKNLIEKVGTEFINKEGLKELINYCESKVGTQNVLDMLINGPVKPKYNVVNVVEQLNKQGYSTITVIDKIIEHNLEHRFEVRFHKKATRYFETEEGAANENNMGYSYKDSDYPFEAERIVSDYEYLNYDLFA